MTAARALALDPSAYRPHPLHAADRVWPQTNCYVDLWIELLHALGRDPAAALAMTVAQDYEGDQFTFFKFPAEDLEALYGVAAQELAVYDALDGHVLEQLRRGRLVLVEVDGFHLPDTRGTSYRREHVKTTIGAAALDLEAGRLGYFHNAGYYELEGEDLDRALWRTGAREEGGTEGSVRLFPYVEFVKLDAGPALDGRALLEGSLALLRRHLRRRPRANPIAAYRAGFGRHLEEVAARPMGYFHVHSFNTLRQLGANFELLGGYAAWLEGRGEPPLAEVREACGRLAADAKAMQFQLARVAGRGRRPADCSAVLDRLERAYDTVMAGLTARYG